MKKNSIKKSNDIAKKASEILKSKKTTKTEKEVARSVLANKQQSKKSKK